MCTGLAEYKPECLRNGWKQKEVGLDEQLRRLDQATASCCVVSLLSLAYATQ